MLRPILFKVSQQVSQSVEAVRDWWLSLDEDDGLSAIDCDVWGRPDPFER